MLLAYAGILSALLGGLADAASSFRPVRPPSIPLAVKGPYLSAWMPAGDDGGNGGYLAGRWPMFWRGQNLGWTGIIRVDGKPYVWMGDPLDIGPLVEQLDFEYTSTKSAFSMKIEDKVLMKITFLSPIYPTDYKRQSLVFSYMQVEVWPLDDRQHDVQLYTDISAEWATGNHNYVAQWDSGIRDGIAYHKVWRQDQKRFNEENDQAEWGNIYYATEAMGQLTTRSGADKDVRGAFARDGKLDNSKDANFRAVQDRWPVFGFAQNFGTISSRVSALFTIGICQEEVVDFLGANGVTALPPLWKQYFGSEFDALKFFHRDYDESNRLSSELDQKIQRDSIAAAGQDYATLTTLAARQVFGATQLVGNTDKVHLFLKEISSNGNCQTIDVIYPAMPMFLYLNPDLIRLLLESHFETQEAGNWPHPWPIHDLGKHYPNATGHPDGQAEQMPLEQSGNHLIMMLAYVQRTGDLDFVRKHYPLLQQWAGYAVEDSLYPANQLSTDDFHQPMDNQTNLALKGMIALEAMSHLASLLGEKKDAQNYTRIAHDYIRQWQDLAINRADNPPHAAITYNDMRTHGLLYNLYPDTLLGLHLVPDYVYQIQTMFYDHVKNKYGVPLDTRGSFTKSDWAMFSAAVASNVQTRDMFIHRMAQWVAETRDSRPFTDIYETVSGDMVRYIDFRARPVMGGIYALLAMKNQMRGIGGEAGGE